MRKFRTGPILIAVAPLLLCLQASGEDWPQWGGTCRKNMAADEKGLPESFVPGKKDTPSGTVRIETATNVKWARKVCPSTYSSPVVADGKVFLCGKADQGGIIACLDEQTGKLLWQWQGGPAAHSFGICGSPVVEGDRLYVVNQGCVVMCLDVNGEPDGPQRRKARVLWTFDMKEKFKTEPADVHCGSCVIDGGLLYAPTSNGIDPLGDRRHKMFVYRDGAGSKGGRVIIEDPEVYRAASPDCPNVVALDKETGRLVATDDTPIAENLLKGQWSSLAAGQVGRRSLVFYGGGDGQCYAFESPATAPGQPVKLNTAWSFDCNPAEYKQFGGKPMIVHYYLGDSRWGGALNKNDGTFAGMGEIIGTPVFYKDRIYVAIGRDTAMGRGRGALQCIDATKTGDVTETGKIWTYQGLDWSCSTVSIAEGLVYIADVAGRLHCVDAETGHCCWVHETKSGGVLGSTLVADGKVYMPTKKGLYVLAAGRQERLIERIYLGAPIYASPVAANGTLYVVTHNGWIWAVRG
ncbi:MAG: PQQ-binding-like beta-propeller repeat protein [Candidatus Nealsonbacteria bacterium]|nr:PQQ-binding-like beta-propeller repeat protein [Candidatus Nealsonbacteria bacterium]